MNIKSISGLNADNFKAGRIYDLTIVVHLELKEYINLLKIIDEGNEIELLKKGA